MNANCVRRIILNAAKQYSNIKAGQMITQSARNITRCPSTVSRILGIGSGISIYAALAVKPDESESKTSTSKLPDIDASSLTHTSIIKNATSLTVNAASTLLSQTTLALIETLQDYAKEMYTLMSLMDHQIMMLANEFEQEKVGMLMIEVRGEIETKRLQVEQLESMLHFAVKVMESTMQAAFQSGCDAAAILASERIQQAEMQVESARKIAKNALENLTEKQKHSIEATAKHEKEKQKQQTQKDDD
ncbi:diablo IAP-binding mitochondrial protein-like [Saccoglossus kowalevskii]|uniref:Direct IAP-binding protein with low pI n=1 Tax=Saccoglossus kowalevskii TaxID=10224 RepID=A0ABM0GI90_SACKO|nr:PREDICTED: diablo homolog, mitochondrial-like [Saccoglossus kowalevskii]